MTEHEKKLEAARVAIDRLFGDASVSPEETRESLKDLRDHIDIQLAALPQE